MKRCERQKALPTPYFATVRTYFRSPPADKIGSTFASSKSVTEVHRVSLTRSFLSYDRKTDKFAHSNPMKTDKQVYA